MKGWVCLVATLLVCMGASAAPPRWAHRRFPLRVLHLRDKRFWIMAAVQTAAMVADVETTERGFQQNQFAEGNPLFGGSKPGRAKLYSILGEGRSGGAMERTLFEEKLGRESARGPMEMVDDRGGTHRIPRRGGNSQRHAAFPSVQPAWKLQKRELARRRYCEDGAKLRKFATARASSFSTSAVTRSTM